MSNVGSLRKLFAVSLTLIMLSGLSFMVFADPVDDEVFSEAALTTLHNGVSEWSNAFAYDGLWSIHLKAPGKATGSADVNEGRIVLKLVNGTTLEDIESIEWWARTVSGYPPHVDLLLDINEDGVSDNALVAEFAYQPYVGPGYAYVSPGVPYGHYDPGLAGTFYNPLYNAWVRTFQKTAAETLTVKVFNDTVLWLSSGAAGPYSGGYFGKLKDFKDGVVKSIGTNLPAPVDGDTVVLEAQIEVDNWIGSSEAYVDKVSLNGELLINEPGPKIRVVKPESKTYTHINIPVEISAYDVFGIKKVWFNVKSAGGVWFYAANRTYTGPTVMNYLPVGGYTFYAWAENKLGVVGRNSTIHFTVRVTELSVDLNPNNLNLKSCGRWVTLRVTPPSGRTADEIDIGSLELWFGDESVPALWGNVDDGVLMVKFSRAALQEILSGSAGEEVEIWVTGEYDDGTLFEGVDTIRVMDPGKEASPSGGASTSDDEGPGKGQGQVNSRDWKLPWVNGNNGKSIGKGNNSGKNGNNSSKNDNNGKSKGKGK